MIKFNHSLRYMPNPFFQFKQFVVYHDKCAMKVGTDGVLLGSWVSPDACQTILDIGSGTGLISLMLAQRSTALLDAIEIDESAYLQSLENIEHSPWKSRIHVFCTPFADFCKKMTVPTYDLIVSNPPYFNHSLCPPDTQRQLARHSDNSLTLTELITGCTRLLVETGRLCLILPAASNQELEDLLVFNQLFLRKRTWVKPTPTSTFKRILVEIGKEKSGFYENELVIETGRHIYSEEFKMLTKDFYLEK